MQLHYIVAYAMRVHGKRGVTVPRQVDHEERRRAIAEAVVRLVSAKGAEAASLRAVAAEAGVSMGAVQHYFTTTDEMLLFALEYGNGLFAARIQRHLAGPEPVPFRDNFRWLCTLLLPLDAESRNGARLWAALIARGCVDEPTRKLAAKAYTGLTAFVVRSLTGAGAGQIVDGLDVARSARHLVSVIEGLRWPLLFGVYTEREALEVLDVQLDQIFGAA
jgi:TetR/AcrR family transcriptional regulator, transcriptional repressor of bet genes